MAPASSSGQSGSSARTASIAFCASALSFSSGTVSRRPPMFTRVTTVWRTTSSTLSCRSASRSCSSSMGGGPLAGSLTAPPPARRTCAASRPPRRRRPARSARRPAPRRWRCAPLSTGRTRSIPSEARAGAVQASRRSPMAAAGNSSALIRSGTSSRGSGDNRRCSRSENGRKGKSRANKRPPKAPNTNECVCRTSALLGPRRSDGSRSQHPTV